VSTVVTEELSTAGRRSPAPRRRPPAGRVRKQRNWTTIVALMAPATIAMIALIVVPVYEMIHLSFTKPNVFTHKQVGVGWANYTSILADREFWTTVVKSVCFAVAAAFSTIVCGLSVASAMMRMHRWLRLAVSTSLILVWAIPQFVGATIWAWFFDTEFGVVNYISFKLGFIDKLQHAWTESEWTGFLIIFIVVVWQAVPFVAMALYGALQTVPEELQEAAAIDGAGPVRTFRQVTLPMIVPVLVISSLLSVIWDFRVLTQVAFTTQGAPYGQTNLLGLYIYQKAIHDGKFGVASAIGVIVTIMLMGLSYFYLRILRKEDR
jgi:N,N'-diacetylchitobiose transport system permease protein